MNDLLIHLCKCHAKKFFACIDCKLRFLTKNTMNRHMTNVHSGEKNRNDEISKKKNNKVGDPASGVVTLDNVSASSNITSATKKYKCTYCPRMFSNNIEMGKHRRKEHHAIMSASVSNVAAASSSSNSNNSNSKKDRNNLKRPAAAAVRGGGGGETVNDRKKNSVRELQFYKNISHNVKINLLFFTNGKQTSELLPGIGEVATAAPNSLEQLLSSGSGGAAIRDQRTTVSDSRMHRSVRVDLYPGWEEDYFALYQTRNTTINFWSLYGSDNITSGFINHVSKLEFCTQVLIMKNVNQFHQNASSHNDDSSLEEEQPPNLTTAVDDQCEFLRLFGLIPDHVKQQPDNDDDDDDNNYTGRLYNLYFIILVCLCDIIIP